MKIRAFFLSVLILCGLLAAILYSRASLKALDNTVVAQAIHDKNTPLVIKSLISKMKDQLEINEDNYPELIKEVENYTVTCPDSASVAVLHSMLAELYQQYFQQNQWKINQRTQLSGYVPEDIREWTSNLFTDKIKQEVDLSLRPVSLLRQTPISQYKDILELGKDSPSLRPTLYDFLAFRAIEIQPTAEIYQSLLSYLRTQSNPKATLLADLDYLQYQFQQDYNKESYQQYTSALDSLWKEYESKDYSVEILIARINLTRLRGFSSQSVDSAQVVEYNLCKESVARYPNYPRTAALKNQLAQLQQPILSVYTDNTVYPGKEMALKVTYKNLPKVTVRIYRSTKTPVQAATTSFHNKPGDQLGPFVKEETFSLHLPNTYTEKDTTLYLKLDQPGLYECVVSGTDPKIKTTNTVSVSRLAAIYRNLPGNKQEIMVTDYLTGKPIEDATVTYYEGQRRALQTSGSVKTDREGLATLPANSKIAAFQANRPGDTYGMLTDVYPMGEGRQTDPDKVALSIFTDRGLYRPGQTIYFKGIAYVKETNNPQVVTGQRFTVSLRDVNGKEVSSKTLTTNTFGSFNGEFTIPKQTLSGTFTINTGRTNEYIQVEEYKRPTFQALFLPIKGEISFGDLVTIQGKAETYSGVALPGGDVTWRITRRPFWTRGFYRPSTKTQIAEGNTTLSTDGTFAISFRPKKDTADNPLSDYQTYEVTATVTDSKGETQEAYSFFSVGESSILLSLNLPQQIEKDSVKAIVEAYTLNNEKVAVSGAFKIVELKEVQSNPNTPNIFQEGRQLVSGNFTSGQPIAPTLFSQLPSGRYRILLEAKDKKGRPAKNQSDFILYGKDDKRPPVFTHTWLLKEKTHCLPGEDARIVFGTSDKDSHILYEWFDGNKRLHREIIELSDANRIFKIPFKEEYGEGFTVSFTFVKEGELYVTQVPVYRQQPNRVLTIRPETFRDKLLPGSKETWKFRITDADSIAVSAEVLASMYDASLDKIRPFSWYFSPERSIELQAPRFTAGTAFQQSQQYDEKNIQYLKVPEYVYDQLNWQGIFNFRDNESQIFTTMEGVQMKSAMVSDSNGILEGKKGISAGRAYHSGLAETVGKEDHAPAAPLEGFPTHPQIRTNFNETAFFYPSLLTNEQGDVLLSFTMPESNTTWKFQLLANTKDLKYGQLTKEVVTSKPLMVLPNLPRFVRQGDQVSISTQVINNSKERISGRVSIDLFNPANDEPIICLSKSQRAFDLLPDSVATVSWMIPVPKAIDLMGIRIIADSEHGSDGEQQILPVLSNQLLIMESTPFFLFQQNEKQIRIPDRQEGKIPFRLTLEITANPVWYAVQALPTIAQPDNDNILSWFAAYYSNTLAAHIAQSNPRMQKAIAQWTAQGRDVSSLYSDLEKNPELKSILLEETPWVLAADNETEQKQRLSLLFDLNRAAGLREAALRQLLQQQGEEGGWSWFKGLPSSQTITLAILNGMAQLVQLNAIQYGQEEKEMQMRALKFLDKSIQVDYENLLKNNKKWQDMEPTMEQIEFLYVRSSYRDIPELGDAREAIRFYTNQAEKSWSKLPLISKGEIALLMYRNGKKEVATNILTWLKKTATTTEEMGMYWANNQRGNDYFTSPIDTHCLLMSAFSEMTTDTLTTDRLKQWLLNQKRTQIWESVPATVNAIYTLLLTGSNWLDNTNTCTVKWANQTYSTSNGESMTGYLKTILPEQPANASGKNVVTIRKEGTAPAWGAIYEQYFQQINEVKAQKGVLNVEKRLFVETNDGTNLQIRPVTPDQPLRVGDKVIVRLIIRTDREMDYVFLKDLRAGCFEPTNQLSGTEFKDGVWYYRSPKDVSENFFFNRLPEGTFVLEYPVYVSRGGDYAGGISTIQCMYAPEFISHTAGEKLAIDR